MRLKGKTILISAAGQGIGRASALACRAEGANVIATDINEAALESLHAEASGGIETRRLDVTDPAAIIALASDIAPLDGLFNCAGFVHNGNILDCSDDDWDFSFNLNVKAMFRIMKAVIAGMLDRAQSTGTASILNMASMASSVKGFPNRMAYGASKAAVIGLTKAVAADFVKQGLRCNALCPERSIRPRSGAASPPRRIRSRRRRTSSRASPWGAWPLSTTLRRWLCICCLTSRVS